MRRRPLRVRVSGRRLEVDCKRKAARGSSGRASMGGGPTNRRKSARAARTWAKRCAGAVSIVTVAEGSRKPAFPEPVPDPQEEKTRPWPGDRGASSQKRPSSKRRGSERRCPETRGPASRGRTPARHHSGGRPAEPTLNGCFLDSYDGDQAAAGPGRPAPLRAAPVGRRRVRGGDDHPPGRDARGRRRGRGPGTPAPSVAGLGPELILDVSNLLPFDFLRNGDRLGRAVVKLRRADGAVGTGFLVAPDVLLTNHHVLPGPGDRRPPPRPWPTSSRARPTTRPAGRRPCRCGPDACSSPTPTSTSASAGSRALSTSAPCRSTATAWAWPGASR